MTMTTVGYGDRAPGTPLGMAVACLAMLSGIVLISLPVAIVGTKFQRASQNYVEHERLMDQAELRLVVVLIRKEEIRGY